MIRLTIGILMNWLVLILSQSNLNILLNFLRKNKYVIIIITSSMKLVVSVQEYICQLEDVLTSDLHTALKFVCTTVLVRATGRSIGALLMRRSARPPRDELVLRPVTMRVGNYELGVCPLKQQYNFGL